MVYGAVSQNGGFVGLTSELGRGTTVDVFLPAVSDAATAGVGRRPRPMRRGPAPRRSCWSRTSRSCATWPSARSTRHGYRVLACADGAPALAAAERQGPIHLLLTDVVMPGMNGRELAARLAAIRPGIRTLFTSGHPSDVMSRTACSSRACTSSRSRTRRTRSPRRCAPCSTRGEVDGFRPFGSGSAARAQRPIGAESLGSPGSLARRAVHLHLLLASNFCLLSSDFCSRAADPDCCA